MTIQRTVSQGNLTNLPPKIRLLSTRAPANSATARPETASGILNQRIALLEKHLSETKVPVTSESSFNSRLAAIEKALNLRSATPEAHTAPAQANLEKLNHNKDAFEQKIDRLKNELSRHEQAHQLKIEKVRDWSGVVLGGIAGVGVFLAAILGTAGASFIVALPLAAGAFLATRYLGGTAVSLVYRACTSKQFNATNQSIMREIQGLEAKLSIINQKIAHLDPEGVRSDAIRMGIAQLDIDATEQQIS